jgi:hypothetical protein
VLKCSDTNLGAGKALKPCPLFILS